MPTDTETGMDAVEYCREIETYLCRKNEGHLIRIVGPVFEQVCGWAAQGVPLKVAFRGIDQYCERYYAKGPRRRPVRVEFCEADILDLFDAWRRAVGVTGAAGESAAAEEAAPRKPALASHIERVVARLTTVRDRGGISGALASWIDAAVRELDALVAEARTARGESRARLIERLGVLDRELLTACLEQLDAARAADLGREADAELAPFRARMPPYALETARRAALHRLVRESLGVPIITYE
jgi:hypothetical protein